MLDPRNKWVSLHVTRFDRSPEGPAVCHQDTAIWPVDLSFTSWNCCLPLVDRMNYYLKYKTNHAGVLTAARIASSGFYGPWEASTLFSVFLPDGQATNTTSLLRNVIGVPAAAGEMALPFCRSVRSRWLGRTV
jgi:hypothetical protein